MKYRNHEGYSDPVVGAVLYNIRKEENMIYFGRQEHKVLSTVKDNLMTFVYL